MEDIKVRKIIELNIYPKNAEKDKWNTKYMMILNAQVEKKN